MYDIYDENYRETMKISGVQETGWLEKRLKI
jgi:hypothetical protein